MKSEYIHIKITPELKTAIEKYCQETGRTITSLTTWLIERELREWKKTKEKAAQK